ncbi:hypothetical protein DERF_004616 [Dermatophagoides farinae]|uniref:Uncharacterized protein n=1 Tax=Dermatophagoides farinae TaxID=6954 RepID=A0A922I7Q3_DERFA|nr:hypothetical protein DERF_004616 [Dermatophagoides farinae]
MTGLCRRKKKLRAKKNQPSNEGSMNESYEIRNLSIKPITGFKMDFGFNKKKKNEEKEIPINNTHVK